MLKTIVSRIFAFSICISLSSAEFFTSMSEMELLIDTHGQVLQDLTNYISKEEKRLDDLKTHLNIYQREHTKAMEDVPNYLGNPINAFTLIKRLTNDLDDVEYLIRNCQENAGNELRNATMRYPTAEDLTGAMAALSRLQDIYFLTNEDLAEGKLKGITYSSPMSASECYMLGIHANSKNDHHHSASWFKLALQKYEEENRQYFFDDVDIMEYLCHSYYMLNDTQNSMENVNKILAIDPNNSKALQYFELLRNLPSTETSEPPTQIESSILNTDDGGPRTWSYLRESQEYEALCRGDLQLSPQTTKNLKCRYLTDSHPFLKIAPIKMEKVYSDPDVIIFHQVINDDEIELIKQLSRPRFIRSSVHNEDGSSSTPEYRISKSAWLMDEDSAVIGRISQRIADMTGLAVWSAEALQIANYGIGGHYEPHYDCDLKRQVPKTGFIGNRIATVLFYMSEVAQGGATVFPKLGLSLSPEKYAAAYWLNLHPSGEANLGTRHAACPVLQGTKWVSNKWLHQGGQEFIKPCNLEYQDESFIRDFPRAIPTTL